MGRVYERRQPNLKHAAQIRSPEGLEKGLDVVVCSVVPGIGVGQRMGQAAIGFTLSEREPEESRWSKAKEGWSHEPTSGLWLMHRGIVNWVNHEGRYASLLVSQQRPDAISAEGGYLVVDDVGAISASLDQLPASEPVVDYRPSLSSLGLERVRDPKYGTGWENTVTLSVAELPIPQPVVE